jgi:hypothetical protein
MTFQPVFLPGFVSTYPRRTPPPQSLPAGGATGNMAMHRATGIMTE